MKEEKMLLILKHIHVVCFNLEWQYRYLTDKTDFLFSGTHGIVEWSTVKINGIREVEC